MNPWRVGGRYLFRGALIATALGLGLVAQNSCVRNNEHKKTIDDITSDNIIIVEPVRIDINLDGLEEAILYKDGTQKVLYGVMFDGKMYLGSYPQEQEVTNIVELVSKDFDKNKLTDAILHNDVDKRKIKLYAFKNNKGRILYMSKSARVVKEMNNQGVSQVLELMQ